MKKTTNNAKSSKINHDNYIYDTVYPNTKKTSKLETTKKILGLLAVIPGIIFGFIFMIFILMLFVGAFGGSDGNLGANTAVINIRGYISVDEQTDFYGSTGASSYGIKKLIDEIKENENIEAVIIDINSGGGSPVGSEEIMSAIKELEEENITTVAIIREVGASGAYWIATGADHIVANRLSVIGSVGVIGSYLDFSGFLEEHNVTYQRLVAGDHKDAQTPFRELTDEELGIVQNRLDILHDIFLNSVKENRGMTDEQIIAISKADVFLGDEALELNLIDELGREDEAIKYIEDKLNITVSTRVYSRNIGFFDKLSGMASKNSYLIGKGIGSSMFETKNSGIKFTT